MEDKPVKRFSVLDDIPNIEILALTVEADSYLSGKTFIETNLRNRYHITIVAIKRGNEFIEHPSPSMPLSPGDIAYVLGKPDALSTASPLFLSTK